MLGCHGHVAGGREIEEPCAEGAVGGTRQRLREGARRRNQARQFRPRMARTPHRSQRATDYGGNQRGDATRRICVAGGARVGMSQACQ